MSVSVPTELAERYEVLEPLGEGGHGRVLRVRDLQLGREAALKLLIDPGKPELTARFLREAEAMARVSHPAVLRVYDQGLTEGGPYLVCELLEGTSMDRLPPEEDPRPAMLDVARGLAALHESGLIHRDVKPENLFRCHDGRGVLLDLGLALDPDRTRMTGPGRVMGTLGYLAPEVLRGYGAQQASDWFSWAVSLATLLEGRQVYSTEEIRGLLSDEPLPAPRWRRISPTSPVARLLDRMLVEDPAKRLTDVAEVEARLAEAGVESQVTGPPHPHPARSGGAGRPRGAAGLVLFLSGCAALATAIALAVGTAAPPEELGAPPVLAASPSDSTPEDPTRNIERARRELRDHFGSQLSLLERPVPRAGLFAHLSNLAPRYADPRLAVRWKRFLVAVAAEATATGRLADRWGEVPLVVARDLCRMPRYHLVSTALSEDVDSVFANLSLTDALLARAREIEDSTRAVLGDQPPAHLSGRDLAAWARLRAAAPAGLGAPLLGRLFREAAAAEPQARVDLAKAAAAALASSRHDMKRECDLLEGYLEGVSPVLRALRDDQATPARAGAVVELYAAAAGTLLACPSHARETTRGLYWRLHAAATGVVEDFPQVAAPVLAWALGDYELLSLLRDGALVTEELAGLRRLVALADAGASGEQP